MSNWINFLGHDERSEISTLIKRMRENKFEIIDFYDNCFTFVVKLTFYHTVPVPNHIIQKRKYKITNNNYEFSFQQINGLPSRFIDKVDGYIIWSLIEEKFEKTKN
jgi:hypothetical protein